MPAEVSKDRAVIDRIDGGIAVLLIGPDGDQHEIDAAQLPAGASDGDVVEIARDGDQLTVGALDQPLTDARRIDAKQRLARIRKDRGSGRFS